MTTARDELRRLTHTMRVYMQQQQALGHHIVPASAQERERWDAYQKDRERRGMERMRDALHQGVPERRAEPKPAAREQAAPARQAPERPTFDASARSQPAPSPSIPTSSEGALWKQFGSRPVTLLKKTPKAPSATPEAVAAPAAPAASAQAPAAPASQASSGPRFEEVSRRGEPAPAEESLFGEQWEHKQEPAQRGMPGFDATPNQLKRLSGMQPVQKLEFLRECLGDCTRCKLADGRNKIVFGDGSAQADLVFVGEGPGYNEDRQGIPFVGKAGQLLDKMIVAMGSSRQQVYICNVVKCRPPGNRDPEPDEIKQCGPFLYKQLETIEPRAIITLGRFASQALLESDAPLRSLRGKWHDWRGIPVMPTYHPAYLLRNPSGKRQTWEDLQKVMKMLGL